MTTEVEERTARLRDYKDKLAKQVRPPCSLSTCSLDPSVNGCQDSGGKACCKCD